MRRRGAAIIAAAADANGFPSPMPMAAAASAAAELGGYFGLKQRRRRRRRRVHEVRYDDEARSIMVRGGPLSFSCRAGSGPFGQPSIMSTGKRERANKPLAAEEKLSTTMAFVTPSE